MAQICDIAMPEKALPLLDFSLPVDRWFLYGGRLTFKSYSFALKALIASLRWQSDGKAGVVLAARAAQNSLAESMLAECKQVMDDYPVLGQRFICGRNYLRSLSGQVSFVFRGTNINPSSLKGVSGAFLGGVDEADECTQEGLDFFEPTIRNGEGMGIHYLFNPSTEDTPCAKMFLKAIDGTNGKTAEDNLYKSFICPQKRIGVIFGTYEDNPFLSELNRRIIYQKRDEMDPDDFANIYLGRFRSLTKGAYYSRCLGQCREDGRMGTYAFNPAAPLYATWDLGLNDLMDVVVFQVIKDYQDGRYKVNVVDFFTGAGQAIDFYGNCLLENGYAAAKCYLPHDGAARRGYTTLETAQQVLDAQGFATEIIPNQGPGAALKWIIATRTAFGRIRFNMGGGSAERVKQLISNLSHYAPKIVNNLPTSTPDHTYSDAADAFGLVPFVLEAVESMEQFKRRETDALRLGGDQNQWGIGL